MKARFTTIDLIASVTELREKLVGMRLNQVYDIDTKTYLMKLSRQDEKCMLLLESGIRIHTTEFEWPKNPAPSGFSMKLRKHLKNKRLEAIQMLGIDRIVDLQFGINEATYHIILELYDRGNIVLTDVNYMILNILRPRATGSEDVKLVVKEKYPIELARQPSPPLNSDKLNDILSACKQNDNMKKCLNPHVIYGPAVIDHILLHAGFPLNCQLGRDIVIERDIEKLGQAMLEGEMLLSEVSKTSSRGYIVTKVQKLTLPGDNVEKEMEIFEEFHPLLYKQSESKSYKEYESFNQAVDVFFSSLEGQKIDQKMLQKEKDALKKLDNIKKDHEKRVQDLQKNQLADSRKAQLIEVNLDLVSKALLVIRSAIANQIGWSEIWNLVTEAQEAGDEVAKAIKKLKLDSNHFTMLLQDCFSNDQSEHSDPQLVDIDLDLSAYANARKYYDFKKHAAKKEQKTMESSGKVYKNAEKKTKQALKEVALTTSIIKARKTFWFEKFLWFISSENFLVIAGRDSQQNELIVKKYLKPGDLYVHADLHGASTVVIKNPSGGQVPPKTQNEAGTMAICYSAAWEAKVVTSAWWVYHHQVSKTAPTGEYLTSGSFMIRGKKNYLPPAQLVLGFGFLFKLDEDSLERHANERHVIKEEDESSGIPEDDVPLEVSDSEDENAETIEKDKTVEDNEEENNESLFPDTEVKFPKLHSDSLQEENVSPDVVYFGDDAPVIVHSAPPRVKQSKPKKKDTTKAYVVETAAVEETNSSHHSPKRGQKSKLKKIKEKYRDQDEEERQLRMEILASAGANNPKDTKGKKKKGREQEEKSMKFKKAPEPKNIQKQEQSELIPTEDPAKAAEEEKEETVVTETVPEGLGPAIEKTELSDEEDVDESSSVHEDAKALASLTGSPVSDDTLLFAVPVCGPYNALLNYKYKVKLMPGNARRGKASKTALSSFLRDKLSTNREKDLLKSVKDQDISRNFPGKVKLSIPNMVKLKKQ